MSKSGIERRVHPRLPLNLPVRISTIDPETDVATRRPFFRASREWCANVSRGGLFIRTEEPFSPGRRVLIELTLPDGRGFDSVGRIAWTKRPLTQSEQADAKGIGIEFLGARSEDLATLERFLRSSSRGTDPHGFAA
jgi:uncharacterized protein (TIGR02266 family)